MSAPLALNLPSGDALKTLAADYADRGFVRLADLLPDAAAADLTRELLASPDWRLVLNQDDKLFELDRATQAGLGAERLAALDQAVIAQARRGFQYRYETIRLPDGAAARAAIDTRLARLGEALSQEPFLSVIRALTGADDISFADVQATLYGPGHFLSSHTDDVPGKQRRAAYVLGLTPGWRIDWGGLLLLHNRADGATALVPRFNTVSIFRVPQPHSVSPVAPWAAQPRLSITGWLRAGTQG